MITEYHNQILLIRNKKRQLWELPGGKREEGEDLIHAAGRELYEETGTVQSELTPFGVYLMNGSYGMNFYAKINVLGPLPDYEIEEIKFVTELPENLYYGSIFYEIYERWKGQDHQKLATYTYNYNDNQACMKFKQ
ncbi:NUDIX domain-containing protein [Paenibacillus mendelii]|nr:NUDIX domain-containing protein [Paenibacillus mendelii]MCQ6557178.1 NUDIX domain-containing protein [Paenibacillus mendelii]